MPMKEEKCMGNLVWNECASGCIKTCKNANLGCIKGCKPGCECPKDRPIAFEDYRCIYPIQCPSK